MATAVALTACIAACHAPFVSNCTDEIGRGQTAFNDLSFQCTTAGTQVTCRATAFINGNYVYCPQSKDVTQDATWLIGDTSILRLTSPGVFTAVALGDTFITPTWQRIESFKRPVSVLQNVGPVLTSYIRGVVYQAGQHPTTGQINGAVVQVLDGIAAGRTAISGEPPQPMPGFSDIDKGQSGYYRFFGIPPGTYTLRVSKAGYTTREVQITAPPNGGSPYLDIALSAPE